jgi:C4-dicarboxylate-binding protein DctP
MSILDINGGNKMKKIISLILLVVFAAAIATGCAGANAKSYSYESHYNKELGKYVFRFAHEETDSSVQGLYVKKFAEVLEEKSNGNIVVEYYPVGQIGDATQQTELLQNGIIDFAIVSPGNTGTIVPENQLFSLHFLFSDDMQKNKELFKNSKALNEILNAEYLRKDIQVLSYWTEGFMQWTSSKKINTPNEFKGFKMRVMPSPMIVAAYEAYGANPTPMPYMEVYSGLQLKMIEGQENPLFAIDEMKFAEVQKYLTLANSSLYVTTTSVNPRFFEQLPEDVKKMVLETVDELQDYSFELQEKMNNESLNRIVSTTKIPVVELTDEEREQFRAASKTAYDRYVQMVGPKGKEILDLLVKEVEEIEKQ